LLATLRGAGHVLMRMFCDKARKNLSKINFCDEANDEFLFTRGEDSISEKTGC